MNPERLDIVLEPYNPWWMEGTQWETLLPEYERPVVAEILADLAELPQMISITGPRRVGKSTAVKHVIRRLIRQQKVDPKRILYFSFDDPEVFASPDAQRVIFDLLVERMVAPKQTSYVFLDEVQRLPRWELFLKKYYDLKYPALPHFCRWTLTDLDRNPAAGLILSGQVLRRYCVASVAESALKSWQTYNRTTGSCLLALGTLALLSVPKNRHYPGTGDVRVHQRPAFV